MPSYDEYRALFADKSPEDKIHILRPESKRLLSTLKGYSLLIQKMNNERGAPQMPDNFGEWSKKLVDDIQELIDLIDALTDWKHRNILEKEQANQRREFGEKMWKHEQAGLPELQQYRSLLDAIEQTAQRLRLSFAGEIRAVAHYNPGSFVEFSASARRVRIGSQAGSHGIYVGYVVTLAWRVDKRNIIWQEHEGLTRSLDEIVHVLYHWIVEQTDLEKIRQKYPWMSEGIVDRTTL